MPAAQAPDVRDGLELGWTPEHEGQAAQRKVSAHRSSAQEGEHHLIPLHSDARARHQHSARNELPPKSRTAHVLQSGGWSPSFGLLVHCSLG